MKERLKSLSASLFERMKGGLPKGKSAEDADMAVADISVTDILPELGQSASDLIHIGAGLVMQSECHDLAKALLSRSTDMLVTPMSIDDVSYIPQQAFVGKNEFGDYRFGYADYFQNEGIEIPSSTLNMLRLLYADEKETFLVAKDGSVIGVIALK